MDFSLAQLINVIILLSSGGRNGGGTSGDKYAVIGIHGGILFLHALINSLPISYLSLFGQLAAAWNIVGITYFRALFTFLVFNLLLEDTYILDFLSLLEYVGVFVLMILIPCVATERASAKFVFTHFNTDNGDGVNNKVYIFVLGLLMSQYTITGYDASAHMVS